MVYYQTPTRESDRGWSDENHPLWRYYGTIPRGCTIYKDGVWKELPDYYTQQDDEPGSFDLFDYQHFLGGREYDIDEALYNELVAAGFADPISGGFGTYPSPLTYPSSSLIPGET